MAGQDEHAESDPSAARLRVLVIYYSQTGDSARVAKTIIEPLKLAGHQIEMECLRPVVEYPFPWRNPLRFFNVLPECLLGPPPEMFPVVFNATAAYDLIVLVYQVWFLSPSLPFQGFFASPAAGVLKGQKVITVSVSRNMWQSASERMKRLVREAGGVQTDNVVVTHQGPAWATFITTPRALLTGKTDRFLGIFPPPGLGAAEFDRVRRFGELIRDRWPHRSPDSTEPVLRGAGAVTINYFFMIPESIGWHLFIGWARVLKVLGCFGHIPRNFGIMAFILFLVCAIILGIPVVALVALVLTPFVRRSVDAYAKRLAAPSGSAT